MVKHINIALVGNPNCGKSALFNMLTGHRQRVTNYSGVTVEKKYGKFITKNGANCTLIDLPGTYTLHSRRPDEIITRNIIDGNCANESRIDIILCVLDATNLHSGLRLFLELKEHSSCPIVVAFNMVDIAKTAGYVYDLNKLSQELGCQIIETVATKKNGYSQLCAALDNVINLLPSSARESRAHRTNKTIIHKYHTPVISRNYHVKASSIINQVQISEGIPSKWTDKIDNVLLHPIIGFIFLLLMLFTIFQAVFSIAAIPQEILQSCVSYLQQLVLGLLPGSLIANLVGHGIIAGVGAVVVFLPQIAIISLFIVLLEDVGYMARAGFLMDKLMGSVGLHGRAFIPLLSSFACAIPGIIATRTIENRNDRIVTILIIPLMACSARLPVYTLLISAFIPKYSVFGVFNLQGLTLFILYISGILFALIVAFIFKHLFLRSDSRPSIMELPTYKLPVFKNVISEVIKPVISFLRNAGTTIVAIMVILWALSSFPLPPQNSPYNVAAINYSFVGILGEFLQPIFAPIGFSWQIVTALIPGIAAREVFVSALSAIYALSDSNNYAGLSAVLKTSWSLSTCLSLITWYVFAPQCISTLATARRETNSLIWPSVMFFYQILLAYSMAFIVYRVSQYCLQI